MRKTMSLLGVVLSAMVVLTSCAGPSDAKAKEAEAASAVLDAGQAVSEDPSAGAVAKEAGIVEKSKIQYLPTTESSFGRKSFLFPRYPDLSSYKIIKEIEA